MAPEPGDVEDEVVVLPGVEARTDDGDLFDADPVLAPEVIEAIAAAVDRDGRDCATTSGVPTFEDTDLAGGQVTLYATRLVDGCLVIDAVTVETDDVPAVSATLESDPEVLTVDVATDTMSLHIAAPTAIEMPAAVAPTARWHLADIRSLELDALPIPDGTARVRVAVLDTDTIDDTHPQLAGRVVARAPWAATTPPTDAHATHVAGIIAAADHPNGRGVAVHVELIDVPPGVGLAERIRWAVDNDADLINMSICEWADDGCIGDPNAVTAATVEYARAAGVLVFAAAGNCGPTNYMLDDVYRQCFSELHRTLYPAAYSRVLAVSEYDHNGNITGGSSRNESVDVSAPGDMVVSTVFNGEWAASRGTSMAAPVVTGSAAVLIAHRPDIAPNRILSGLFAFARDAGPPGWDNAYGAGMIDPVAVAQQLAETDPPKSPEQPAVENTPHDVMDAWVDAVMDGREADALVLEAQPRSPSVYSWGRSRFEIDGRAWGPTLLCGESSARTWCSWLRADPSPNMVMRRSTDGRWQVSYPFTSAYPDGPGDAATACVANVAPLDVRGGPGVDWPAFDQIPVGQCGVNAFQRVVAAPSDRHLWRLVEWQGQQGWVPDLMIELD